MRAAVVLAGGQGKRVGAPKATLAFAGATFLEAVTARVLELELDWCATVLPPECAQLALPERMRRLLQPHPEEGQLSSLRLALAAGADQADQCMVCLVDLPNIQASTYRSLWKAVEEFPEAHLWVPSYNGQRGHPVIFSRRMYSDLVSAPLEQGARWAVARHRERRCQIEVDDAAILRDIDTPADLAQLYRSSLSESVASRSPGGSASEPAPPPSAPGCS